MKIFGIYKLQLTNCKYWENKIRNLCNFKDYLCNYKLFVFVKLASDFFKQKLSQHRRFAKYLTRTEPLTNGVGCHKDLRQYACTLSKGLPSLSKGPTLEKLVKYTRIVCQNVEDVLLNMFLVLFSKKKNIAYFARYWGLKYFACDVNCAALFILLHWFYGSGLTIYGGRLLLVIALVNLVNLVYMLVNRVYKPKREETSLEISPMIRHRNYFFGQLLTLKYLKYFLNEESEGVLTDILMNFHDWHLTWLYQLKPNVKVGKSL